MNRKIKPIGGFTLPELIITIAIVAILMGIATPIWHEWTERAAHRTVVNQYHTLFSFARWSAASRHSLVTVCPLSDQEKCTDNWQQPISVFFDANNDKKPDNGTILRTFSFHAARFRIRSRTGGRGYLQFNARGMIHGATGSVILCPKSANGTAMSYMAVNKGGRFRVEHDTDGDGIIKLPWGVNISCKT